MKFSSTPLRQIPSLSRLLDVSLTVEVVPGEVTSLFDLQSITVSIPSEEFVQITGDELELLYLRPMVKAMAEKINLLGNVRVAAIPLSKLPDTEAAYLCTKGRIPVLLRLVRRTSPDRHQILIHVLVQPESEDGS
jgi:hypothetical protein